ncbi:hypothetical protein EDB85DRAFT_732741 [Lactarius pseudohatsudake]|nr:hypothetical protein EDB85DRAFT_732741 [Lactarius pseudohatsudake]
MSTSRLRPCEYRLSCGHLCRSVCPTTNQDSHRRTKCNQPCVRVTCPRAHPCPKLCSDDCGNCMFPMYNVKLPCGHIVKSVPCHQLGNLETVKCVAQVSKRLPGCEHSGIMACDGDPTDFECKEICGGQTACCSRMCKSRCHECQEITRDNAAPRAGAVPPVRTHHKSHPCERMLKCQHFCGLACSSDHSCNPKCPQSCRQRCGHQICQKECWEPCPPCMEPCEWRCSHHSCPVVCGSICSRLPCDKACEWRLDCGHMCPSICGEPCEQQTCVVCLPDERKVDVVDLFTQRHLDEIDHSSDDISERLIRLECGHIFTVQMLDSHCNMSEYYKSNAIGAFTATKTPPVDFQTPPSCPTCHGPISALRYGRVTKKANLDISEQNVARSLSSTLEELGSEIESFSGRLDNVKDKAKLITFDPPSHVADFDILSAHRRTRFGPESETLPHEEISQASMTSIHGFSVEEGKGWNEVVRDLLELYRKVVDVARTRGPHVQAYGAALATLYRLELSAIASDPERASDTPEHAAMIEVNKKIGQPPHNVDTRFQIEAFFLSFELRYILAEIAQSRIEGLNVSSSDDIVLSHERLWQSFVSFIYESCIHDAEKALKIAENSSASRLVARAGMYILRGKLELFRFEILAERTLLSRQGLLNNDRRNELIAKAQLEANAVSLEMTRLEEAFLRNYPITNTTGLSSSSERAWFKQNCWEKRDELVKEYNALMAHLTLAETECEPLKAKGDTGRAPGFSQYTASGARFYGCMNGHVSEISITLQWGDARGCPVCNPTTSSSSAGWPGFNPIAAFLGGTRYCRF